jgi:branched-chain amino acid transport system substrate-binding protein/neutral amino acid transport system substrate-binding protein
MAETQPPKEKKTIWIVVGAIIAVIVVVLGVLAAAGFFAPPAGPESIKIGTILPLTGTLEDFGKPMKDAADMAAEEINAAGGVLGRPIELIHCDSQTRPAAGANCAAKLVYTDRVLAIIGAASSGVSQAVSTITLEQKVVQISPASTSPLFTTFEVERAQATGETPIPDKDVPGWFWRTAPSDALQGQVAAILAQGEAWQTFGIIAVNNPYGKGLADAFTENIGADKVVAQVNYIEEQTDYTSELQILANADPDAVFFVGYPGDGLTIMKNWNAKRAEPGWDWDWFFSEGLKSSDFIVDLKDAGIDVSGVKGTAPIFTGPNYDTFRTNYMNKYGREPQVFDAHTYDAVYLIAAAIQKAGEATSDAIRTNLVDVSSPGGTAIAPGEWDKVLSELAAGNDINYEGGSGSVDLNQVGEPLSDYEIWQIVGSVTEGYSYEQVTVITADQLTPPTIP